MKAAGGTAVAIEGLPHRMQKQLDEYGRQLRAQQAGDHRYDQQIKRTRREIERAFAANFDDSPATRANAKHMADIVDTAAKNNMRTIAMEPDVDHPYQNGKGYNGLRDAMRAMPGGKEHAIATDMDSHSTPAERKKAHDEIVNGLRGKKSEQELRDLFKTMDTMRQGHPPVNAENLKSAIDAELGGNQTPMRHVIQDFRNRNFATSIRESNDAQRRQGRKPHVAVFAGYGHIHDPGDGGKPLFALTGMEGNGIERPGMNAKH